MYKKVLAILCALMVVAVVTGCNTVHGVGEDIQSGGKAVSNAAS
ncbi:entericidin B [Orbus hercynius]|uniref:Entericidin B n=1 Tax=Orbus hercynius TaxID=593135 RepID=A0A495RCD9_9GAMM|nr:entericidin A/B family lipoprotein [Orbus hercynius]RKS85132.1 entericidin B [Orbus hercynius]